MVKTEKFWDRKFGTENLSNPPDFGKAKTEQPEFMADG